MKIFEFAKAHNLTSKQVSDAAIQLGLKSSHASANLSSEDEAQLAAHFLSQTPTQTDPVTELASNVWADDGGSAIAIESETQNANSEPEPEAADTTNTDDGPRSNTDSDSPFDGSDFYPRRIYKYAKKRGLTLEQAIDGGVSLGMFNVHRHRDLSLEELQALDDHFRSISE